MSIPQTKPYVSVFEPERIQINGVEYPLRKRSRSVLRQLSQLAVQLDKAKEDVDKIQIGYDQLGLLVDAPQEEIDELDMSQVTDITLWLTTRAKEPPPADGEGKNPERPGDGPLPA